MRGDRRVRVAGYDLGAPAGTARGLAAGCLDAVDRSVMPM
jgi:hypothetical protein